MIRTSILVITTLLMTQFIFAQTTISEANFRIFDSKGNSSSIEQIITAAGNADVIFLGENHDDAVAHYLQAEIFRRVFEAHGKDRKVFLSLEMFERDQQIVVDEFLRDLITEKKFMDDSRPWNNYKTDYKPLVDFAKANKLPVIAANAPRRYVNMVSRNGRDALNALSPEAKRWLAPLPYAEASKEYATKFNALMGQAGNHSSKILDSQSLWDATMADSMAKVLKKEKKALIVHLNGSFHSEYRLGTPDHLMKYRSKTKFIVVTMRYEDNFQNFDKTKHEGKGDFVILTDAKVPRSFKQGN